MAESIGTQFLSQPNIQSLIPVLQEYQAHLYSIAGASSSGTIISLNQSYSSFLVWFVVNSSTNFTYSGFMCAIPGSIIYGYQSNTYINFSADKISAYAFTPSFPISATIIGIP